MLVYLFLANHIGPVVIGEQIGNCASHVLVMYRERLTIRPVLIETTAVWLCIVGCATITAQEWHATTPDTLLRVPACTHLIPPRNGNRGISL
jgi:hypothetical protein